MTALAQLNLDIYDQPRKQHLLLTLKQTKSGHDILVCSKHPAPTSAIREAEACGLPLLTFHEVGLLAGVDHETTRAVLEAKRGLPGCEVRKVLREVARS